MIYLIYLNTFEDRSGDDAGQDGEVRLQLTGREVSTVSSAATSSNMGYEGSSEGSI